MSISKKIFLSSMLAIAAIIGFVHIACNIANHDDLARSIRTGMSFDEDSIDEASINDNMMFEDNAGIKDNFRQAHDGKAFEKNSSSTSERDWKDASSNSSNHLASSSRIQAYKLPIHQTNFSSSSYQQSGAYHHAQSHSKSSKDDGSGAGGTSGVSGGGVIVDEGVVSEISCKNKWGSIVIRSNTAKGAYEEKQLKRQHLVQFEKINVSNAISAYDISIIDKLSNAKWQPGDSGVKVDVDLETPVETSSRKLLLMHLCDNGEAEVVETASFKRSIDERSVTGFSFVARSFSIYAIVAFDSELLVPRRFYHFYGHSTTNAQGWNVAYPYQFKDQSNDVVNIQIVKTGDKLREPPVPADILDENGEVVSMFQGWYVVGSSTRDASSLETKLDASAYIFKWPVGVTQHRLAFTNAVVVPEQSDWDYYVVPLYERARFLQFNENSETEQEAGSRIIRRKLVAINDESGEVDIKVSDVSAALKNSRNEYFCGWRYLDKSGEYANLLVYSEQGKPQDTFITIDDALFAANDGNVIALYPYYVSAHFLNFDANAKSVDFVGALFVRSTSNFSQVDVSGHRKGYDFDGWQAGFYDEATREVSFGQKVTDKNGNFYPNLTIVNPLTGNVSFTTDANCNIRMNEDVTLYGTWVANTAAHYTIIVWQQRVTDDMNASEQDRKYYYVTHFTSPAVTATTQISESLIQNFTGTRRDGQTVTRQNLTSISGTSNITGEDFTGFRYNRFSCSDATVAPDGSTVVNVYYDRKLMTFIFGQTTTRRGLYGQSFDWPSPPNGSLWQNDNTYMTFMDAFIPPSGDDNMTFTSSRVNNMTSSVAFYKQQFDGTYLEVKTISMQSGRFSITDKFNGFHAAKYRNGNGSEVQLGSKDSSGNYDTVQTSGNTTLRIYFDRNNYELMYIYEDINGEHIVRDTGKSVAYQSSLAEYDIAYTNALLDWSGCDISNRTFEGWFEDASLTVPFDFTATMPDGKKFIYAKWAPLKYRVIIDPNGGELLSNEATWFYVDPSKEETIEEYTPTRKYKLDLHNGNYYYHYDQYDPVNDKHTDQYDPVVASNATRKAYYTTDINDATSNDGSNPNNRYSYDSGAYAFMGWFEVLEDGSLAIDPFSFGEPPSKPVTLRAVWRRLSIYTMQYESIDPDGINATEIIYDPQHHLSGNIEDGYVADAETTLAKTPTNYNKNEWMWEGWQVVDTFNNNIPLTGVRSPGDIYVVKSSHADLNNVIHFRAVYKKLDDGTSARIPKVTNLILDSNENASLSDAHGITNVPGRIGTYLDGTNAFVQGLIQGIWFAGQQNNFSVDLSKYSSSFTHTNGYFLLGWNSTMNCPTMLPSYYANETIGVDVENNGASGENILYAVWEPQIYIEFINDTEDELNDISFYVPGWVEGDVFRVNSVQDTYKREKFTAFSNGTATFNLAAGEKLCLVLPDGADKDFTTMGTCQYPDGQKLVIERIQPQDDVQNITQSVYSGEDYMVSGTMKVNPEPVKVRFTKEEYPTSIDIPVRYFIHHPDGTVAEITADDAIADGYPAWVSSRKPLKTITNLGFQTNDLAATLRYSTTLGVVGFLSNDIREQYGHTTIGIGSRDAVVTRDNFYHCEYRTITNVRGRPNGGSYLRFVHEDLLWSRYSQIWNKYDATNMAVYVAFYQRIPVHVTLHKTVVGTEEDKDVPFTFTATYSEHSTNIEYIVTHTYQQTRRWTKNWWSSNWKVSGDWSDPIQTSVSTNVTGRQLGVDTNLFDQLRNPETVTLKSGERIPFTIFYDRADPQIGLYESTVEGKKPTDSGSGAGGWDENYTQTRTITQIVTHNAAYRYETVTIQEAENSNYTLTSIEPDPLSQQSGHNGKSNLSNRTYVISSLHDISHPNNSPNYYDYTPLDTTVFVNTRKSGTLKVVKHVDGNDDGDTFTFNVTLGETVINKSSYVPPIGTSIGPYGKVFTFSLANGESMTLPGLPAGASYKVEEIANVKYAVDVPSNATGTIVADDEIVVNIVNARKRDLTITMKDKTVSFNGNNQQGYEISSVAGTDVDIDIESYLVSGLKNGHNLVVEHYVIPNGVDVGTYTGKVENTRFTILDGTNDVTDEYLVKMTPGTLTIESTKIIVEVTGNKASATYDGTEHVCQGYTYVVKDASAGNVVANDSIFIYIDPNYQQAYRTVVGTSEMLLDGNVNVSMPEGFKLQKIDVVENGSMTILPKLVTVVPRSTSKFAYVPDPQLEADVQGIVGDEQIAFSLAREPGEEIGEYEIFATAEPHQGNYDVECSSGVLAIGELELYQRSIEDVLPAKIPVTDALLEQAGIPVELRFPKPASDFLNEVCDNGLYRWENLRLGMKLDEPLMCDIANAIPGKLELATPNAAAAPVDFGYAAIRVVQKNTTNGWVDAGNAYEFATTAGDNTPCVSTSDDTTGIYRSMTMLVPNAFPEVTNHLFSANAAGVVETSSDMENVMLAVPWKKIPSDPDAPENQTVADWAKWLPIDENDYIQVIWENYEYSLWKMVDGHLVQAVEEREINGKAGIRVEGEANELLLQRGMTVWLCRSDVSKKMVLAGQYVDEDLSTKMHGLKDGDEHPAYNMLANCTLTPLAINSLVWVDESSNDIPAKYDQVLIPSNGTFPTLLLYSNGLWGASVLERYEKNGRMRTRVVRATDYYIPVGQGVWFYRTIPDEFMMSLPHDIIVE